MEEDNKTVTMPLSEYRRMEEIVVNYKNCEERIKKEYDDAIKLLNKEYDKYYDKCYEYSKKVEKLEKELLKYKTKKWYQFWK